MRFLFDRLRIVPVDFTSVMSDFNQQNNGNLRKYRPRNVRDMGHYTGGFFRVFALLGNCGGRICSGNVSFVSVLLFSLQDFSL